ncbi:MAG TPA: TadG family pilus assembly protein, partial [Gammaproteobacteria bacterium]|nr:TadG family pilus assembly protein [Gammaproteobacteria bacterium]
MSLVTLMLFGALAVDVGYIAALTAEMQSTADGASLAGASAMRDGKYEFFKERALSIIERNQKSQGFLALDDQVIQLGRWDRAAMTFTPNSGEDLNRDNAVRVVSRRNKVPLFFAPI